MSAPAPKLTAAQRRLLRWTDLRGDFYYVGTRTLDARSARSLERKGLGRIVGEFFRINSVGRAAIAGRQP